MSHEVTVYLDCDGVLADFTRAANTAHGFPHAVPPTKWDWYKDWGLSDDAFWAPINELGDSFYPDHVNVYPWTHCLIGEIVDTEAQLCVATANADNHGCNGKREWIKRVCPEAEDIIFIHQKWRLATPNAMLIDDNPGNVEAFREHGGVGILWPQPWNHQATNAGQTIRTISDTIHAMKRRAVAA
jgi:FMN phosphatase YigB (HAD superfamily)